MLGDDAPCGEAAALDVFTGAAPLELSEEGGAAKGLLELADGAATFVGKAAGMLMAFDGAGVTKPKALTGAVLSRGAETVDAGFVPAEGPVWTAGTEDLPVPLGVRRVPAFGESGSGV